MEPEEMDQTSIDERARHAHFAEQAGVPPKPNQRGRS